MATLDELRSLVESPREDIAVEYKDWLDPASRHGQATIAKAAIALANHGGGFIVLGFEDGGALTSKARPDDHQSFSQDGVNSAIRRYADPEFHAELHEIAHPTSAVLHIVIAIPGGHTAPIMSKRDCENVITQHRCYIRKPGPRTEEPQTKEEWRALLNRCVQAQREDMLEAIRAIVTGRVEEARVAPIAESEFENFIAGSRNRLAELIEKLPDSAPARFPCGSYEMSFALVGSDPCPSLSELNDRLAEARQIRLSGWSTFLQTVTPGRAPYPIDGYVEAWLGRPVDDDILTRSPALCDFWRASINGHLYTIRGYVEDALEKRKPGTCIDVTLPVLRIGEGLLFASRFAATFPHVEHILIRCKFRGLSGRSLTSVTGMRMMFDEAVSQSDEIELSAAATPAQVQDNLAEVLLALLSPLYERFDFFRLPAQLVSEEISRLQQNRF